MTTEPTGGAPLNIGDLAKPATVLIERISDAIGALWAPRQVRRIAAAEAEAARTKAASDIEINDLRRRAAVRLEYQQLQQQRNIEQIVAKAIPDVGMDADPARIQIDWLTYFFDRGRLVSDLEMQSLWSRLLAGEANKPGAFSRRTIELVSLLEKDEANLFTCLCGFVWSIGFPIPIVDDLDNGLFVDAGLNYAKLAHLEAIGLIRLDLGGFKLSQCKKQMRAAYFDRTLLLTMPNDDGNNTLRLGQVQLTASGSQLALIAGAKPVDGCVDRIVGFWQRYGCEAIPLDV